MAYSVINGAVGISPAIDKINQSFVKQAEDFANVQIEQLVFDSEKTIYQPVLISFDVCRKEIQKQMAGVDKSGR